MIPPLWAAETDRSAIMGEVRALLNAPSSPAVVSETSSVAPTEPPVAEALPAPQPVASVAMVTPTSPAPRLTNSATDLSGATPTLNSNPVTTIYTLYGFETDKEPDRTLPVYGHGVSESARWTEFVNDEELAKIKEMGSFSDSIFVGSQAGYNSLRPIVDRGKSTERVLGDIFVGTLTGAGAYSIDWRIPHSSSLPEGDWSSNNVAVGDWAFVKAIGKGNVLMGDAAGAKMTGNTNAFLGIYTGSESKGDDNVAIGSWANTWLSEADKGTEVNRVVVIGSAAKATKNDAVGIGSSARVTGARSVAIGASSSTTAAADSVALGSGSVANRAALNEVEKKAVYTGSAKEATKEAILTTAATTKGALSVGSSDSNNGFTRQITNLAAGTSDTDAVNVAQLKATDASVGTNTTDITNLKAGFDLSDKDGIQSTVTLGSDNKQAVTFKATGIDDAFTATVDSNRNVTYGLDKTKLASSITGDIITNINTSATTPITNIEAKFKLLVGNNGNTITLKKDSTPAITFAGEQDKIDVKLTGDAGNPTVTVKAHDNLGKTININDNSTITDINNKITAINNDMGIASAWDLFVNGGSKRTIAKGSVVNFKEGTHTAITTNGNDITIDLKDTTKNQINQNTSNIATNTTNIAKNTTAITNINTQIGDLNEGDKLSVKYDSQSKDKVTLGGAGANPVTVTNVKDGVLSATSSDAVNGSQLYATNQNVAANTTTINNLRQDINNGTLGGWDLLVNDQAAHTVNATKPLTLKNGSNVTITRDGSTVTVGVIDTPKFVTVKAGDITINNDGRISGVKDGKAANDVATVGQVSRVSETVNSNWSAVTNRMYGMDRRISSVGAMAAAFSGMMPLDFDETNPTMFSVGFGHYSGQNAVALGVQHYASRDLLFNGGISWGDNDQMFRLGATWRMGRSDRTRTQTVGLSDPKTGAQVLQIEKKLQGHDTELKAINQDMIDHMKLTVKQSQQIAELTRRLEALEGTK